MSLAHDSMVGAKPAAARLPLDVIQLAALWVFVLSGFFVIVEPAPYELLFLLSFALFLPAGLTVRPVVAPLVVFLLLYNLGGFGSVVPVMHLPKTTQFFVISLYMAITGMFFCFVVSRDTMKRMAVIKNAYVWSAVLAAAIGMIGYFNIAGMGETWAPLNRAQGTFKDPNVMSTFIILPAILLFQGLLSRTQRHPLLAMAGLMIIMAGLFFAFSRGAWVNCAAAMALAAGLTFIVTPSLVLRTRILLIGMACIIAVSILVSIALSFENVRSLFLERANLFNPYDAGEYGRFGNQLRSLTDIIVSPNGFGPTRFREIYGQDPHNVFLNAFVSYGWIGGISYLLLCISTFVAAWRTVFVRTPWQGYAIAVFATTIATMLQGVQIDTDHWRHFYLMLGLSWGLFAATVHYQPDAAVPPDGLVRRQQ